MGLYNRYILPNLIDLIARTDSVMQPRSLVVPEARGRVLEIGIGSGLNLSLYDPTQVSEIVGVDPAAFFGAAQAVEQAACRLQFELVGQAHQALCQQVSQPCETAGHRLQPFQIFG